MKVKVLSLLLLAFFYVNCLQAANDKKVSSPDGRNTIVFSLDAGGTPTYQLLRDGKMLISPSVLGFIEKNNINKRDCLCHRLSDISRR